MGSRLTEAMKAFGEQELSYIGTEMMRQLSQLCENQVFWMLENEFLRMG